jgi:NAD(P)H-hydrate epimerase
MLPLSVLSASQARRWDRDTAAAGLPLVALMENAGRAIAAIVTTRFPGAVRQGTLVAAGPGNNGGDGWVIARALDAMGLPVWVVPVGGSGSELNQLEARLARESGVREVEADGPWPAVGLVVDAILGTGAEGKPRPNVAQLVSRLAEVPAPVVAVDGPTGLDLDTGVSHDALPATMTVTFGGYRRGHLLARDEVGDVVVVDIGFVSRSQEWPHFFRTKDAARAAPQLPASSHKGSRGRVVIVGGDAGMTGAARLAARAGFAAGAGLVHVVAPAESVAILATAEPDLQTTISGFDQLSGAAIDVIGKADAVVVGPGLGRGPGRAGLIAAVGRATGAPLVVDADGLMAFAANPGGLAALGSNRALVITPHAGEFRSLFPSEASNLGVDPWTAATGAAQAISGTVLLKGVPTVVALAGEPPITVAAGNPGLATGGSGDTLSGLIAAFLAQGVDSCLAAAAAAQALGEAGDLAARRQTARAARPMDVIAALPDVWRRWDLIRREPPGGFAPILHELPAPIRA